MSLRKSFQSVPFLFFIIITLASCTLLQPSTEAILETSESLVIASEVSINATKAFQIPVWCGERKEEFTMDGDTFTLLEQYETQIEVVLPQKRILGLFPRPSTTAKLVEMFTLVEPSNFLTPGEMTLPAFVEIVSGKTLRIDCEKILKLPISADETLDVEERLSDLLQDVAYSHGVLTIESESRDLKIFQSKIVRSWRCVDQGSGLDCVDAQLDNVRTEISGDSANIRRTVIHSADPQAIIAFICNDGDSEVCVINFDGTGFMQLTENSTHDTVPRINASDQVAYQCNDGDNEICTINADGTGFKQLTMNGVSDQNPSFNASGQIAYECLVGIPEICVIGVDGTGFMQLTTNATSDIAPSINDFGKIAYYCDAPQDNICVIESTGAGLMQLTFGGTLDTNPSLNNFDLMAYQCEGTNFEICVINADGTGFQQLTNNSSIDVGPSLNNSGLIAFMCNDGDFEICVMNAGGGGFMQLTNNNSPDFNPFINDRGQIAYSCNDGDFEVCVIRSDGTGFQQLTNNGTDDFATSIN